MSNTEELLAGKYPPYRTQANEVPIARISTSVNALTSDEQPLTSFAQDGEDIDEQILRLAAVPEQYGRYAAQRSLGVLEEMERNARGQALENRQQEVKLTELAAQLRKAQDEIEMYREREAHLTSENSRLQQKVNILERQLHDGFPRHSARLMEANDILREKLLKYKRLYNESIEKDAGEPNAAKKQLPASGTNLQELYGKIEELFKRTPARSLTKEKKIEPDFKQLFTDILHRMQDEEEEVVGNSQKENDKQDNSDPQLLEKLIRRLVHEEIGDASHKDIEEERQAENEVLSPRPRSAPTMGAKTMGKHPSNKTHEEDLTQAILKALGENREVNERVLAHLVNEKTNSKSLPNKDPVTEKPSSQCDQCSEIDLQKLEQKLQSENASTGRGPEPENTLNLMGEYKWTI